MLLHGVQHISGLRYVAQTFRIALCLALCWLLAASLALAGDRPLVIGCGADRYSKAKHYLSFAKMAPNVWITEPLVYRGDDYRPRPGLVERWERQGHKYRLHTRPGVRFHNGAEWDAAALQRALEINAYNRSETLRIKPGSYRIIDWHTLELETAHHTVHFAGFLSHPFVAAYAPGTDFINHPVGTGPFVFEEYKRGRYIKVRRNDAYWGDKPPNERVIYRFLPDPQTRLLALLNGECDIIFPVDPQMLASLPPGGPYQKVVTPLRSYVVMSVNWHGKAPFDLLQDLRLRRAVAYAIDRRLIADTVYQGLARPARSILAPCVFR